MPRRSSGPRLWFDKKRSTWTVVDGKSNYRTGFGAADIKQAERALRDYIEGKHKPVASEAPLIADVIAAYAEEHVRHLVSGSHIQYDLEKLAKWWGTKKVTDVSAALQRAYVASRNATVCSRREMAFLNAAINHWRANHAPLMAVPKIKLPPRPQPRPHFSTISQAAKFLRRARKIEHLARFFLIGWYTGSRRSVINGLRWDMIDLERGIMHRKPPGEAQTKKRAPSIPLHPKLLMHLRRWHRRDAGIMMHVIHWQGLSVDRLDSWQRVREAVGLPAWYTPHTLRHTRASRMLADGVNPFAAAKFLGMTTAVLESVYGHTSLDWQKDAANVR